MNASWPNQVLSRHQSEETEKSHEILITTAGVLTDILTEHILNMCLGCYCYTSLFGVKRLLVP
jgi:hypothetical protein